MFYTGFFVFISFYGQIHVLNLHHKMRYLESSFGSALDLLLHLGSLTSILKILGNRPCFLFSTGIKFHIFFGHLLSGIRSKWPYHINLLVSSNPSILSLSFSPYFLCSWPECTLAFNYTFIDWLFMFYLLCITPHNILFLSFRLLDPPNCHFVLEGEVRRLININQGIIFGQKHNLCNF